MALRALLLLLAYLSSTSGKITTLLEANSTACIAEKLRLTNRYICDSKGSIICVSGWSNPGNLCNDAICDMNGKGCLHGKCIFPNVCACKVGWDGPNCDVCIPLGGCRHGSCNKPMECNCKPGWTGGQCNKPICPGCVNGCCHDPNKCICNFGWKGPNCTECQTLSNCKNGKCVTHPFQCKCNDGWRGLDCVKPICRPGCHPVNGRCNLPGECICRNGWGGRDCNECVPYPGCNGTCINNRPWTCSESDSTGSGQPDTWVEWSQWSICSQTCGQGKQRRGRACPDVDSVSGNCIGDATETRDCVTQDCAVDGQWADWTKWAPCSVSCGSGTKQIFRACANPIPSNGGKNCTGLSNESATCFVTPCPIDGRWSSWKSWGECSGTCGKGSRRRERLCDSPVPSHGGIACGEESDQNEKCNQKECPIDGTWGTWSDWSACSRTCGEGTQQRTRSCSDSQFGGKSCIGNYTVETSVISCWIQVSCPIDGAWATWGEWDACSRSCGGGGIRLRERSCSNPMPMFGGDICPGAKREEEPCSSYLECPTDNVEWTNWSSCSATCGGGTKSRVRLCLQTDISCTGEVNEERNCNEQACPNQDGSWNSWSPWSTCSKTCQGGGMQRRNRTCRNRDPGGNLCIGSTIDFQTCNEDISCSKGSMITVNL